MPGRPRFVAADFTVEGRRAALALSAPTPPTAIFAASDEMAYGVLTAAREIDCACRRTCPSSASTGTSSPSCSV
jgi:DNA-binding LacI/PurR family transcriptional regulator